MQESVKKPSLPLVQSATLGELFQECLELAAEKAKLLLADDRRLRQRHKIDYEPHMDRLPGNPSNVEFPERQSTDVYDRTKGV